MTGLVLSALLWLAPNGADGPTGELAPPVRIEAARKPIDTDVGHAAPFVGDFDGDGVNDLVVGQRTTAGSGCSSAARPVSR
jgi:hypothetical protein